MTRTTSNLFLPVAYQTNAYRLTPPHTPMTDILLLLLTDNEAYDDPLVYALDPTGVPSSETLNGIGGRCLGADDFDVSTDELDPDFATYAAMFGLDLDPDDYTGSTWYEIRLTPVLQPQTT